MSGIIELKVRKGIAKSPNLFYYPEWYWQITGENGTTVDISPSWEQLRRAIYDTLEHEVKVDAVTLRNSNNGARKYQQFLREISAMANSIQLKVTEAEDIYKDARRVRIFGEEDE